MKNILATYEKAYGQAISLPKSEVYYSRSVPDSTQDFITSILGVRAVMGNGKYGADIHDRKKQRSDF